MDTTTNIEEYTNDLRNLALGMISDKDLQRIFSTASLEELMTFFIDNGFEFELIPPLGYKFADKKAK